MKLRFEKIEMWRVLIPMHEPFRISSGEVKDREVLLIRCWGNGAFGWGESSSMPGNFYSADTPESCCGQLLELLPSLVGQEFDSIADLEEVLDGRNLSPFVRVAVETAGWEMLARQMNLSLREVFGLPHRPVPSGLAIGLYDSLEELREGIERNRFRDYKRLKIKIKRGHDVELVRAVREWYGNIPLYVDANADYSIADLAVFEELDKYNLMMFEQPFAKEDIEGMAELQVRCRTPICIDESADDLPSVQRAIDYGACRIVNIKLQRVGGYSNALRIILHCEEQGIPVWMGTMPELGVGSAQALVLATHQAFRYPTDVEASARWYTDDVLAPEMVVKEGGIELPRGPGLGYEVSMTKVKRYATQSWNWS